MIAAGLLVAAAPAEAPDRHAPPPGDKQHPPAHDHQVPGFVLAGMAAAGLAIVGLSARRRQSGRSVTH